MRKTDLLGVREALATVTGLPRIDAWLHCPNYGWRRLRP